MDLLTQSEETLQRVFGYSEFRPKQKAVIEALLNEKSAFVLMPTGGGKSLCYQIPSIVKPGTGLIVSPLIALMQDQVVALKQLGVRAEFLNSSLERNEAWKVERDFLAGDLDLLYVAPERLMSDRFLSLLKEASINLFAIDEAHCISQWGHDFRPEYSQLSQLKDLFPNVPRVALTATADRATGAEIIEKLGLSNSEKFVLSFDRPNILYRVGIKKGAKRQLLQFIQKEHEEDAGIVYCLSRRKVEEYAEYLSGSGLKAFAYHAGMSSRERHSVQSRFIQEESVIVVATVAFGMGIDKPNVRFVAHTDLPKSIEGYYQETGRAGRDGLPATAWMVYGLGEVITHRMFMQKSDAEETFKRISSHKLSAMLGYCEATKCRRQVLLGYFDEVLEEPCGHCDICLEPVRTWDGTVATQKALSTVYRTGQKFGVQHLIDNLLGNQTPKVLQFGHSRLTTFGVGKELNMVQWNSVFRQLIAHGLLKVDIEGYGGLSLTEEARPILRGEREFWLREDQPREKSARVKKEKSREKSLLTSDEDQKLFDRLRKVRLELAKEQKVPPYVIFHDTALVEMAKARPKNLDQMLSIQGVGVKKLEKYGDLFLRELS
ncbi:DNA helicase RecQ [Bdellovibrionales bacterium]|nr:DNA helicase RecQ [Bdellovibrionales bacterium]